MGILRDTLTAYGAALDRVDDELAAARPFDRKTAGVLSELLSADDSGACG